MMDIAVLTILPEMFASFWEHGIVRRAVEAGILSASAVNIRDFASGRHKNTDDMPYGGGSGMVMKPEPLAAAIRASKDKISEAHTIYLTPQGRPFTQKIADELSSYKGLIFVCGRYEGIDERICQNFIDDEISIGDFVLTGGELAAMVIIEAVIRLIPGALGGDDSAEKDSFADGLLEHAHYTRPSIFEDQEVPEVLLSGHHARIEQWRLETSLIRTFLKRPDLLKNRKMSKQEIRILNHWQSEIGNIIDAQSVFKSFALSGDEQTF
jgi:tRNA (guanine37-N1)-methyltransferase